ncbi:hypothetical protein LZ30DRAFT_711482 [Colletotrichum cereale]|nr:hypothetical protein LZ30DRAFT_711482 [Colletotrichum cereale]
MKNLSLLLAAVAALVTNGAAAAVNPREAASQQEHHDDDDDSVTSAGETATLRRRDCDISCPFDRTYCYYAPYNYKCNSRGGFSWSQRDTNCELPTSGCWCFCDFRPDAEGSASTVASGEEEA